MRRYIPGIASDNTFGMVPHEHGGYVEYGCHAALLSEKDAEIERLQSLVDAEIKSNCEISARELTACMERNDTQADNKRLREALENIAEQPLNGRDYVDFICYLRGIAGQALAETAHVPPVVDERVPPMEVWFQQEGKVIGKIINVDKPAQGGKE